MTEKEKMISGRYYVSSDNELIEQREKAKGILFRLNGTNPQNRTLRDMALRELIGSIGTGCWIESPFNCDFGYNITIGNDFYSNVNLTILDCAPVTIGNNVFIGPNVGIYTPNHSFDAASRNKYYERSLPVNIKDNVWIGGSVSIMGGVTIGENSIIGAGSVVTRDIPENVIAAGVPCRVLRKITDKDILDTDNL